MDGRNSFRELLKERKESGVLGGILQRDGGGLGGCRWSVSAGTWEGGSPGAVCGAGGMGWNVGTRLSGDLQGEGRERIGLSL